MERFARESKSTVEACVEDVLPKLGLAFAVDASARSWGITRATPGIPFDELKPGQRVRLRVQAYEAFSLVGDCERLS